MKVTCERVLVKTIEEPKTIKTNSGLSMPNPDAQYGIEKAVVVTADTDKVKEGDKVLIYSGAGHKFLNPTDGKEYRVIALSEIVVIYE